MDFTKPWATKPLLYIDFEFNHINSEYVNLVCCSIYDGSQVLEYWLHENDREKQKLKNFLLSVRESKVFWGYAAVAEGRSFLSLGLDPMDFKWIDGFFEYRCLTNNNDRLLYGPQLVGGKIKKTVKPPPKWQRTEEDTASSFKPTHSLAEATFKLTKEIRNTEHKDEMRDIIISADPENIERFKDAIQKYCTEDVIHLPKLFAEMQREYYELGIEIDEELENEMLLRGEYAAATAKIESWGYPIDEQKTRNFSKAVESILEECQREINSLFPDITPFRWNRATRKFSWNQKATKEWIRENPKISLDRWVSTDKGDISLSLEAWQRFFDYKHSYPKDNFGAQMVRYLKLKQQISGFIPSKAGSFWDSVGPDGRVRPYTNPFGAQSSRNQQSSRSFLFLKTAWMRSLCMPPEGKAIAGIDYGSEEFLISALLARDAVAKRAKTTKQIEAYASGDVYLAFAKEAGMAPQDATKSSHKRERDLCKSTVLGLSYLMSKYGLATKLSADTGTEVTVEEAQEYIDLFYEVYEELGEYQAWVQEQYQEDRFIKLPCGWYVWGDNDNFRSVTNVPVQGCLHGDSRVPTEFGFQKIKDLCGKNRIDVWDGERFVKADAVPAGKKKVVEIYLKNGQKIACSPEHKFLCVSNDGKEKWKTPEEFKSQTFIRLSSEVSDFDSNFKLNEPDFSETRNEKNISQISLNDFRGSKFELGVLLGRMASDGWVSEGRGVLWIVAEHEESILGEILKLAELLAPNKVKHSVLVRKNRTQRLNHVKIYSKVLEKQLKEIGLKTRLDHPYIWSSKELLRGFLKGYVDGDGGVSGKGDKGRITISFGKGEDKEEYASQLQKAFSIFGIRTRLYRLKYRTNLSIMTESRDKFLSEIGFLNPLKREKAEALPKAKRLSKILGKVERVDRVEFKEEEVEMYDIANCPDQRFSAEGFVTHNTGASILRKAVSLCMERGLKPIITLHDALYIEYDSDDYAALDTFHDCMKEAFVFYFKDKKNASLIKLDAFAWSPDYAPDSEIETPEGRKIPVSNVYIDERASEEYEQFSRYFENREENSL